MLKKSFLFGVQDFLYNFVAEYAFMHARMCALAPNKN